MYQKVRGIVLRTIKYNDKNSIVHFFSSEYGMLAFSLPQSAGRVAKMKRALFMPLSILEIDTDVQPGREILSVKDVRQAIRIYNITSDPVKNAIGLFMAELVGKIVKGGEENGALYRYVETSVEFLDSMSLGVANFHICFLLHLGAFLGIEPDFSTYKESAWFDMNEGVFVISPKTGHSTLPPDTASVLHLLSRMNYANMHLFKFTREQRGELLDSILAYYGIHNGMLSPLKSPEILKQLFI